MSHWKKSIALAAAAATAAAVALAPASGIAKPRYDGVWSVSIVTKKGDCIASYRYPMKIANGVLGNGGDLALDISGKVSDDGAVRVLVSHGDSRAIGSGKLSANIGSGSWKTTSCSGSWTAERRSV